MFGLTTRIEICPPKEGALMWEYPLDGVKKLLAVPKGGAVALLYDCSGRKFVYCKEKVKLQRGVTYRLFGMAKDFTVLFSGDDEFRAVTNTDYRFAWRTQDGKDLSFMSRVCVSGKFAYKITDGNHFTFAAHHLDEVSAEKPLMADYSGGDAFDLRTFFHESVKPIILDMLDSKLSELQGSNGLEPSALNKLCGMLGSAETVNAVNQRLLAAGGAIKGLYTVQYTIGLITPVGDEYKRLMENFNAAALIKSDGDILRGELENRQVVSQIEKINKEN